MPTGKITRLVKDRGFGFIAVEGSSDEVFFHSSSLPAGEFDNLSEKQTLEFDLEKDPRNPQRNRAANVRVGTP
jgi:CspA family cold shock protein